MKERELHRHAEGFTGFALAAVIRCFGTVSQSPVSGVPAGRASTNDDLPGPPSPDEQAVPGTTRAQ